jgi:hypothetical protein
MVLQVLAFKLRLKWWKMAKSEYLALASALEPKWHNRAHASSARVSLLAIASPATPWVFRAVTCARAHFLRSSARRAALERTAFDRVHP